MDEVTFEERLEELSEQGRAVVLAAALNGKQVFIGNWCAACHCRHIYIVKNGTKDSLYDDYRD